MYAKIIIIITIIIIIIELTAPPCVAPSYLAPRVRVVKKRSERVVIRSIIYVVKYCCNASGILSVVKKWND